MALNQIKRSVSLVKVALAVKKSCSQCLCRSASTATTLPSNKSPSKFATGWIAQMPALDYLGSITSPITNDSSNSQQSSQFTGKNKLSITATTTTNIFQSPIYSSPLITNCILPGVDFSDRVIYTTPTGYWRLPVQQPVIIIDRPATTPIIQDPIVSDRSVVNDPANHVVHEKQAARLIKIRRKKMKKHKLRKLRKKMFFVWAKRRQRRESLKQKVFHAGQLARMTLAEEFDAEAWVQEFLRKATTDPSTLIKKKPLLPRPTRYVLG